jgi:hypothetical protein
MMAKISKYIIDINIASGLASLRSLGVTLSAV